MTTSSSTLMAARATRRRRGVDGTFSVDVFVLTEVNLSPFLKPFALYHILKICFS